MPLPEPGASHRVSAILLSIGMLAAAPAPASAPAPPKAPAIWTQVELVENTAEGPAYDRCHLEESLGNGRSARWRFFYGEAGADPDGGWTAIRPASGCEPAGEHPAAILHGTPYLVVDITLGQAAVANHAIRMNGEWTVRKLGGFGSDGAPVYENATVKRTIWVPQGGSAVVPILTANARETDTFRLSELLFRIRADAPAARPAVEYGEIAVSADVPRAEIFLDGGFAGRTSGAAPIVLTGVRVGDREVVVRDASGRETRTVARVVKGRRSPVRLTLMNAATVSAEGLRALGTNPQGAEEFWRDKDGAIVVRVPAGELRMGSAEGDGEPPERPQHVVRVSGFLIDKTEVTWGQYTRFVTGTGHAAAKTPVWGTPEAFPASSITWPEARDFCAWAGGRLPTEAEWERAARGDDTRVYPWGDTFDPWRCNTRDGGPHAPTAAGAYAECASPYGVLDMAGGFLEWCSDWYAADAYAASPADDPTGPASGTTRVVRGGHWMSPSFGVRTASRIGIEPGWPGVMLGFRCVQDDRRAGDR